MQGWLEKDIVTAVITACTAYLLPLYVTNNIHTLMK